MRAVVVRRADELKEKLVNTMTVECNATYLYQIASISYRRFGPLFICSTLSL
jgi:hypothetical protein